jgi:hypothetical protein
LSVDPGLHGLRNTCRKFRYPLPDAEEAKTFVVPQLRIASLQRSRQGGRNEYRKFFGSFFQERTCFAQALLFCKKEAKNFLTLSASTLTVTRAPALLAGRIAERR